MTSLHKTRIISKTSGSKIQVSVSVTEFSTRRMFRDSVVRKYQQHLIDAWYAGAQIQVWVQSHGVWKDVGNPSWSDSKHYRIKPEEPRTIRVRCDREMPLPEKAAPVVGTLYYHIGVWGEVHIFTWTGGNRDLRMLKAGNVFLRKEDVDAWVDLTQELRRGIMTT